MDSGPTDSSGTDDDGILPLPERPTRGLRTSGNGRGPANYGRPLPSVPSYEEQLRKLETDAYLAVLSAFVAGNEAISWAKERLMCELRKELRVQDEQHSQLLSRVFQDNKIMQIRERRQQIEAAVPPQPPPPQVPIEDRFGSVAGTPQSRKKQKTAHISASPAPPLPPAPSSPPPSKPAPIPSLPPPQPAEAVRKRVPSVTGRGKKGKQLAVPPSAGGGTTKATTSGASTGSAEAGVPPPQDAFIGRRLRTRWPDDDLMYEAKVTNYDPQNGMHELLYDIDTTTEWVNLKELMDTKDFAWIDGPAGAPLTKGHGLGSPGLPQQTDAGGGRAGSGRGMRRSASTMTRAAGTETAPVQPPIPAGGGRGRFHRGSAPGMPGRVLGKVPGSKGAAPLPMENGADVRRGVGGGAGNLRPAKGDPQILEELAKKVENLDDVQDIKELERAKQMFKEREEQLRKALAEVGSESSDDDESGE
ncbi:hypothetical protein CBR_g20979 [Chara braunii]|uniref:ENT domain-containing protein n=1 Tax=Chara braunii TaxID=69332 RepID=A0A388L095_CHABU|nr:hypothetical protein CBR_g20979 [Chara braunii]|eukprot:GBG75730.1 hypothetical protein CBR_g20979 [Chara braunii]